MGLQFKEPRPIRLHDLINRWKRRGPTCSSKLRNRCGESKLVEKVDWYFAGQVFKSPDAQIRESSIIAPQLVKQGRKFSKSAHHSAGLPSRLC